MHNEQHILSMYFIHCSLITFICVYDYYCSRSMFLSLIVRAYSFIFYTANIFLFCFRSQNDTAFLFTQYYIRKFFFGRYSRYPSLPLHLAWQNDRVFSVIIVYLLFLSYKYIHIADILIDYLHRDGLRGNEPNFSLGGNIVFIFGDGIWNSIGGWDYVILEFERAMLIVPMNYQII